MAFFKSKIFILVVLVQLAGLFFMGLGNWANWIQYASGFGMAYAMWDYWTVHKQEMKLLREQMAHLHERHGKMIDAIEHVTRKGVHHD